MPTKLSCNQTPGFGEDDEYVKSSDDAQRLKTDGNSSIWLSAHYTIKNVRVDAYLFFWKNLFQQLSNCSRKMGWGFQLSRNCKTRKYGGCQVTFKNIVSCIRFKIQMSLSANSKKGADAVDSIQY